MLVVPPSTVRIPSSFPIILDEITDNNGNVLDFNNTFVEFNFYCNGKRYDCVSNPEENEFVNAKIVNGALYLIFEDYPFDSTGFLSYIQHDRSFDANFESGHQDTYSELQQTKIRLVR